MANLKFTDTHNMVAFLSKPAESKGFEQIVDFLNAHTIKYTLTVNPTIYTSCIEQFGATVKAKTVNGEVLLQALVDGKKIIIIESITTAWNEFSSTMASTNICLATNQKFNFSKYIFKSMVKNLDNVSGNFLMYPRFVQVFVNQQLKGMPTHKRIYIAPSHIKRIYVGKGFSGRETPLFQKMIVQDQEEVGEGSEMSTDPHHTPTIIQPSTSQPQKKQRSIRSKRKDTEVPQPSGPTTNVSDEVVNKEMDDSLERGCQDTIGDTIAQTRSENVSKLSNDPLLARGNTLRSGEDRLKLKELMELCTTLQLRVLTLETTKTTQANEIASLKMRVGSSRMVESSEDEGLGEVGASKQGRIADINANEDIYLVNVRTNEDMFGGNDLDGDEVIIESVDVVNTAEETRSVVEEVTAVTIPVSVAITTTTKTAITDVEMTLAQALAELKSAKPKATTITTTPTLTTTTATITITAVSTRPRAKGLVIHEQEQAPTPTISSQQPSQVKVQDKVEEEEEERLAKEKAQQIEEANIAWDDVQAKRTEEKRNRSPTRAQKRSIMCTYLKNMEGWKPKSLKNKSFANIQELFDKAMKRMLKNFDREDLEVLWSIVKARFKKIEAVNYMDNFLLLNLKTTFEHHVEDNVWKNRQGLVKVLN
ncbi:hypothetical protein Tco_0612837 [Tanacetum coccineum]